MTTATEERRDNHSHRLVMVGLENRKLTDVEREGGNKKGKKEQKEQKEPFCPFCSFLPFLFPYDIYSRI
jgi:hypothetical protein